MVSLRNVIEIESSFPYVKPAMKLLLIVPFILFHGVEEQVVK